MTQLKRVKHLLLILCCLQIFTAAQALEVSYSDRYFDPVLTVSEQWTKIPASLNPVILNFGVIQRETSANRIIEMKLHNNESSAKKISLQLPPGFSVSSGETLSLNASEEKVIQLSFTASQSGKQYGEFKVFKDSLSTPVLRVLIQHEVKE
jgi:hypothetical protein